MHEITAVVTGATDGIGAATALLLEREGARVIGVGRSAEKAARVRERGGPRLELLTADLSSMQAVRALGEGLGAKLPRIDLLIHCVGVLTPRAVRTAEDLDLDFAVSYLARFLLTRALLPSLEAAPSPVLLNVAASSPSIPSFARVDLSDAKAMRAKGGMKAHGQAQLANDVFVAELRRRSRVVTVGYGPGSVETSIRREVPRALNWLLRPFFKTRTPEAVATDLLTIYQSPELECRPEQALFYDRGTPFTPDPYVTDAARGAALFRATESILGQ